MSDARAGAVVVTGGGSGIGRAATLACAHHGAPVAVLDLDQDAADAAAEEALAAAAGAAISLQCDVRDEESVANAIASAVAELGEITGLVCCAGIATDGLAHEVSLERWNLVLGTNSPGPS